MKTLQVDAARTYRGGEAQVLALARGLRGRGHPALIVSRRESALFERATRAGLDAVAMPGGVLAAIRLARLARSFGADLIHAHDAHSLSASVGASRLSGRPLVLSRRVDFPIGKLFRFRYTRAPRLTLAVSREVARVLKAAGVPEESIRVVYDGVDVDAVVGAGSPDDLLTRFGLPREGLYVGNVASLTDHKGQCYLIEAAPRVLEKFPDAVFLIAGEGELRRPLESLVRAKRLETKVLLLGFVPDVHRLYGALRVFVMPSHLEGLGSSVLEAMSAGVPVVAAEAGGIPEIVAHERTGLLVPARNPEALASAIIRVLDDPVLASALARSAHEEVRARFSVARMVEETLAAYEYAVGK